MREHYIPVKSLHIGKLVTKPRTPGAQLVRRTSLVNSIFVSIIFLQVTYVTGGILKCRMRCVLMAE